MKKLLLGLVMTVGACGAAPMEESWDMAWLGQCDGAIVGDDWYCGEQSGVVTREPGALHFGVADATVTENGPDMFGTVKTATGESCFVAHRH